MRGDGDDYKKQNLKRESAQDREQIERLKDRVSTLENIILDRERGFRGGFDKL
jgi:wobble nucleotide-excising tRNase